ncbi:MAG: glycoside hydrolase family 127 protein, partial [Nocardiopsaceae bacterium]|nr:glycoside hydrolase family 127 protein [Nocardiopsaceae bacterium]
CACCPPNIMRLIASLPHYLAAAGPDGLWLSQYATGSFAADVAGERTGIKVTTGYPWQGQVRVEVTGTGPAPWGLRLRVPGWCRGASITVNDRPADGELSGGWLAITRHWQPGDVVVLELPLPARLTEGHPRADAVRGCLAIERGPLVYCLEQADQPAGTRLDDVVMGPAAPLTAGEQPGLLGGVVTVTAPGYLRRPQGQPDWWPYGDAGAGTPRWDEITLTAVPYFTWANRGPGAMRVWIPGRTPP